MQETTFKKTLQTDGLEIFPDTQSWLNAFYSKIPLKKLDQANLYDLISQEINLTKIEFKLNYTFKNKKNLILALMQSTFCYEMKESSLQSNERLEFLGDSLINFIVGKNLFHKYMENAEGDLSRLRGALVNEEKLAELARSIGLGEFIFLGRGEFKSGGHEKDSILADTFEALFAAVYFDSENKIEVVEAVFSNVITAFQETNSINFYSLNLLEDFDTKSKLQELTMTLFGVFPTYKGMELPQNGGFNVQVWLGDKKLAEMAGPSKKKVEKLLAKKIIEEKLYENMN